MYISLDFTIFYNPYKLQHDKLLNQMETQISLFLLYIVLDCDLYLLQDLIFGAKVNARKVWKQL